MDTASHLLLGFTLAGASLAIPAVAADPTLQHALIAASMLGSHAPDLDAVARLKGQTTYLRVHRGITHSLPAPFVWALLIGWPMAWLFGTMDHLGLLMLWAFLAVCFHVTLDLFNGYGVQCLRPFTRRWLHLDSLCLFDPYIFGSHLLCGLLWLSGLANSIMGTVFEILYGLTILYVGWRLLERIRWQRKLRKALGNRSRVSLLPLMSGRAWQFVAEGPDSYEAGTISSRGIVRESTIAKTSSLSGTEPALATMQTDGVRAFLAFATNVHVQVQEKLDGYEVTWSDLRFWSNDKLPYTAAVTLDRNMMVQNTKLGWDKKTWEPPYV
ncbi:inner membrane protein [Paenibacillus cellulosilyticus]|uniref:Inner membrane protein n=1 Tax=Paenibacillus cellulosilyticus TaxID=375489 RepID=A0A2V2YRL6_9BACL|nr:metal-dependent hydrolase [Paenibacillus cellulosilyticus]PWW00683.1 inner membrane protein [Paenibacillus cellulosilyticus]QKS45544.1 metal-dependent hydrolase [Paenibacillus cellulosilyticus]